MIFEEFGTDIRHISGTENAVADATSTLPTVQGLIEKPSINNGEVLALEEDEQDTFSLDLFLVQEEQ